MPTKTKIEWTETTWNPVTGCTKISPGCDNCYAERFAERFRGVVGHPYEQGFDLKIHIERIRQPLKWKTPRIVFVNSMSDLFQRGLPLGLIDRCFETMEMTPHTYQILTKRSSLMRDYVNERYADRPVPANIWLGASVEDQQRTSRINHLREIKNASVRFLSLEPLLGPLPNLNLADIHWVIVGGESGSGWRKMEIDWVREIRDQCVAAGVRFFFKQYSGFHVKGLGRLLDGREWNEMPSMTTEAPSMAA